MRRRQDNSSRSMRLLHYPINKWTRQTIKTRHCLTSNNAVQHANRVSFNYHIFGLRVNTQDLIISLIRLLPGITLSCVNPLSASFSVAAAFSSALSGCQVPLWHWRALEVILQMAPTAPLSNKPRLAALTLYSDKDGTHRWLPRQGHNIELKARMCEGTPTGCPFHFSMISATH